MLPRSILAPAALLVAVQGAAAPRSYSHVDGLAYVQLSQSAYCSPESISSWSCRTCDPTVREAIAVYNPTTNIQAFVAYRPASREIVVSFRGTVSTSIRNWIENLDAVTTEPWQGQCPGCKVHMGFYVSYLSVAANVSRAVAAMKTMYPLASLSFTGHSLGGAMASIAAADFVIRLGMPVHKMATFGSPRAGDTSFAAVIADKVPVSWRVTHLKDIVPHVPSTSMGFQHIATEIYYTGDTTFVVCNGGEDGSCSARWKSILDWSIADHLSYLAFPIASC